MRQAISKFRIRSRHPLSYFSISMKPGGGGSSKCPMLMTLLSVLPLLSSHAPEPLPPVLPATVQLTSQAFAPCIQPKVARLGFLGCLVLYFRAISFCTFGIQTKGTAIRSDRDTPSQS